MSIIIGGLIGALLAWAVSWAFTPRSDAEKRSALKATSFFWGKQVMDNWATRLAVGGFAAGAFLALSKAGLNIGFMIGFGLPIAAVGLVVGFVIDLLAKKKEPRNRRS
jgi:hypothetical protein